jgi:hypothetical protein
MADHDAEIQQLEQEIEAARPEMEAACDSFLDAAAARLADFWPEYVEGAVRYAGDAISEMDPERLRKVKAEVEEVQGQPKEVARRFLVTSRREAWPHFATIDELVEANKGGGRGAFGWVGAVGTPMAQRGQLPEDLTKPMDAAGGAVAKPFKDADLPVSSSRWSDPVADVKWSTAMVESIQQYGRRTAEVFEKAAELHRARGRRERDDALSRWNDA